MVTGAETYPEVVKMPLGPGVGCPGAGVVGNPLTSATVVVAAEVVLIVAGVEVVVVGAAVVVMVVVVASCNVVVIVDVVVVVNCSKIPFCARHVSASEQLTRHTDCCMVAQQTLTG